MNLVELRCYIVNKLKNGESYGKIGSGLGISRAMVKYIETHENYKPSKSMKEMLKLDPTPALEYTRTRNQKLNEIARELGFGSWCKFCTYLLKEYEECQNITQK
jgi:AraC-like DNA-binding protein